jgi:hypothetical protein
MGVNRICRFAGIAGRQGQCQHPLFIVTSRASRIDKISTAAEPPGSPTQFNYCPQAVFEYVALFIPPLGDGCTYIS